MERKGRQGSESGKGGQVKGKRRKEGEVWEEKRTEDGWKDEKMGGREG